VSPAHAQGRPPLLGIIRDRDQVPAAIPDLALGAQPDRVQEVHQAQDLGLQAAPAPDLEVVLTLAAAQDPEIPLAHDPDLVVVADPVPHLGQKAEVNTENLDLVLDRAPKALTPMENEFV